MGVSRGFGLIAAFAALWGTFAGVGVFLLGRHAALAPGPAWLAGVPVGCAAALAAFDLGGRAASFLRGRRKGPPAAQPVRAPERLMPAPSQGD